MKPRDDDTDDEKALPKQKFIPELHLRKNNKLRFVANSHRSTLVQLAKWITKALKAIVLESEAMWRDVFMSVGIDRKATSCQLEL